MGLIKELQTDLDNAVLRIVSEYRSRLHADAVKLCGDATEADDLVMRTFDAALRDTSSYDESKGALYPWLNGVLHRIYAKTNRRLVDRGTVPVDPAVLQELAGISESTVSQILENSDHDVLRAALDRLDPAYKRVLVMYYFGDLPVKSVAAALKIPLGTVLWRLSIARKILAKDLGGKLGKVKKHLVVIATALLAVSAAFGLTKAVEWVVESHSSRQTEGEDMNARQVAAAATLLVTGVAGARTIDVPAGGDVAAAVSMAEDGDVVRLAGGTYVISDNILVDKAITVRGEHAAVTTVKSNGDAFTPFTLDNAEAVLERMTIRDCSHASCGAVWIKSHGGMLQDLVVRDCRCTLSGNYTGIITVQSAAAVLRRCTVTDCSCPSGWGGAVLLDANATIDACYLHGNTAGYGGGVYKKPNGTAARIVHLTAAGNTANGPDLYSEPPGLTDVHDSWIQAKNGNDFSGTCNLTGAATAAQLKNAGESVEGMSATDVDGLLYDEEHPSIGAHALVDDPVVVRWLGEEVIAMGVTQTARWSVEGVPAGATVTAALYDPTGVKVGEGAADFGFEATMAMGGYTLIVTVDYGTGYIRDIVKAPVARAGLTSVHVSKTGSATFPYDTEETALADIQTAVDICLAGGTVTVHDGTYSLLKPIEVSKALTLKSANGCGVTVLERDPSVMRRLLYLNDAEALAEGFTIRNGQENSTTLGGTKAGSGVLIDTAGGTLDKCVVENCTGTTHGGAVMVQSENAVVRRTIFRNNTTPGGAYGGAIYLLNGGIVVDNCLFYGNSAAWGGALYADGAKSYIRVYNTTVQDNRGDGGAFSDYASSKDCKVYNSIGTFGGTRVNCLDTTAFVDRANGNYSLTLLSTAVDAGTDYEGMCETDLAGCPRVSGDAVDIGAYEYAAEELSVDVFVDIASAEFTGEVTYTLTPMVSGAYQPPLLDWTILRNDGTVALTAFACEYEPLAFKPTDPGSYSVHIEVTDGGETAEKDVPSLFVATTRRVYVDARGGNVSPYATPATAATTFDAAWALVGPTAVVTVAEGTYDVGCCLDLSQNRKILGVGPDKTVLRRSAGANDRLARVDHPNAEICGCALTGVELGYPEKRHGACVLFGANGGLVENCFITNNVGNNSRGVGVAFEAGSKGVLRRCQISGNAGGDTGGAVYVPGPGGGVIDDCLFFGNAAHWPSEAYVSGATEMTNCTIAGVLYLQGSWSDSHFVNCYVAARTIYDASAGDQEGRESTFSHCASAQIRFTLGEGNFTADPLFVDAANGDYRLDRHSPLRKAGLPTPGLCKLRDLAGVRRVSGGTVDIGCYQRVVYRLLLMVR